jgi:hypothetical protein
MHQVQKSRMNGRAFPAVRRRGEPLCPSTRPMRKNKPLTNGADDWPLMGVPEEIWSDGGLSFEAPAFRFKIHMQSDNPRRLSGC